MKMRLDESLFEDIEDTISENKKEFKKISGHRYIGKCDITNWATITKDEYEPEDDIYEKVYKDEILKKRKALGMI